MRGFVHHIELYVADLERSRRFYELLLGGLGYEVFQQWPAGCSFLRGETYVVLVQTHARFLEPAYHRCRVGLNHLAFHGGTRIEVDNLVAELVGAGYTLLYPDRHPFAGGPECYAAFFEDPDRIKIEIAADN